MWSVRFDRSRFRQIGGSVATVPLMWQLWYWETTRTNVQHVVEPTKNWHGRSTEYIVNISTRTATTILLLLVHTDESSMILPFALVHKGQLCIGRSAAFMTTTPYLPAAIFSTVDRVCVWMCVCWCVEDIGNLIILVLMGRALSTVANSWLSFASVPAPTGRALEGLPLSLLLIDHHWFSVCRHSVQVDSYIGVPMTLKIQFHEQCWPQPCQSMIHKIRYSLLCMYCDLQSNNSRLPTPANQALRR